MSAPPAREIDHGRTSVVYEYDEDRVVKVFLEQYAAEADIEEPNSVRAYDHGLTPLRCHGRVLVDGRPGLVFDRVHGDSLTTIAERDLRRIPEVSRVLATEHVGLHSRPVTGFRDVRELAVSLLDTPALASLDADERTRLATRLLALPGGDRALHLDYHPQNVFAHDAAASGYAVLDWQSTCQGDPAADVAMTRLLFTEAELFPGTPLLKRVLYQSVRRFMLHLYLRAYLGATGLKVEEVDRWTTAARILRLGWLDIPSERARLLRGIRASLQDRSAGGAS